LTINSRELIVSGDDGTELGVAGFEEPPGYSKDDVTTWRHTSPVVFDATGASYDGIVLGARAPALDMSVQEARAAAATPAINNRAVRSVTVPAVVAAKTSLGRSLNYISEGAQSRPPLPPPPPPLPPPPPPYELAPSFARRFGEPGPLIDLFSIDAGASYIRETALSASWHTAFRAIHVAQQDTNVDRFCVTDDLENTSNFAAALDRCGEPAAVNTTGADINAIYTEAEYTGCWQGYASYEVKPKPLSPKP
jgi:hypothetical protein